MIAIGSDQGGYELKQEVMGYLKDHGYEYTDVGSYTPESCDYPDIAAKVVQMILNGEAEKGILICGTGIGISISANRYPGIRAALCTDCFMAEATREHNDANVLCMGGRVVGPGLALKITETFLTTEFSQGERHIRRLNKIEENYNDYINE
ncbi:MAG: ribose 5-phosphate isomerase B [Lachnospiraceae bacterium]|nr:ribose 5-phosphate isomerase B [Lachnospiraceae bacterium]